jgi:exodeoxyribonuclease VII small subunit
MEEQELLTLPLEELFAKAEELTGQLADPELALEEAFEAYQEGMKIIRACNSRIDQVEKQMLAMNRDGELVPFDAVAEQEG